MNRKAVAWGVAIALGLGFIILIAWGDEPLRPEVERALRPPERLALESNLFYPFVGFTVAADKDPAEEGYGAVTRVNDTLGMRGSARIEELRSALQAAWIASELEVEDPAGILCALREEGCIASLWARRAELSSLAAEHSVLMARYRRLADYPSFRTDLVPHAEMPLPRFEPVLSAHRLVLAVALVDYLSSEDVQADAVLDDLRFSRRLLGQADSMLFKMVAASMTADALHAYAALMDADGVSGDDFPVLTPLSAAERSLESSLTGEFRFVASVFRDLPNRPETHADLGVPAWLGGAGLRPLFKPNLTLNRDFSCWQATLDSTRLPPGELMAHGPAKDSRACKPGWSEWLLNPLGAVLRTVAGPDFRRYAGRVHDLDGLITLVNLKRSLRRDGVALDGIAAYLAEEGVAFVDPYTRKPMQWDGETRILYFTGAVPHLGYDRLPLEPLRPDS